MQTITPLWGKEFTMSTASVQLREWVASGFYPANLPAALGAALFEVAMTGDLVLLARIAGFAGIALGNARLPANLPPHGTERSRTIDTYHETGQGTTALALGRLMVARAGGPEGPDLDEVVAKAKTFADCIEGIMALEARA